MLRYMLTGLPPGLSHREHLEKQGILLPLLKAGPAASYLPIPVTLAVPLSLPLPQPQNPHNTIPNPNPYTPPLEVLRGSGLTSVILILPVCHHIFTPIPI
jgi:hypothetical protein